MASSLTPAAQATLQARLAPFDALDACHQQVMSHLQVLEMLLSHLERQGVDDEARHLARTVCRFFSETARNHHADEERNVFPALLAGTDVDLIQHVQRLLQDHGWLEEDWHALSLQLAAVADGYGWYELDALRAGVEMFTALYHDHIALEESLVYPQARRAVHAEFEGLGRRLSVQRRTAAA